MFWAHPGLGSSWFWAVRAPPQILVLLIFENCLVTRACFF
ncbi:hypothetical protein CRE_01876 [Caenorhabditis remanei]|uniref:Uncharacterized protein n=1 Tax=Caenorhabditis remanei TaxID=31234 RepID=E3LG07_CAERE|nr:hypothetical protein CRE_01876 [Caenorhabditis remanei]